MKIALCTPWMVKCGIYTYSRDLAYALAQEGVEVCIIRFPRFGAKNAEILQNIAYRFPKDADIFVISHEYGLFQGFDNIFYRTLRSIHPNIPICTIMHAVGQYGLDAVIAEASSRVIVHNEFCRKNFGFPSTIIPHGTKPVKCPPIEECKKTYGVNPKIPIVGYVGFISNYKGIETIIEAVSKIPNVALVIGGGWHTDAENEYIANLKELSSKKLGGRSQWLGFIPDDKLAVVYGSFDLVMYPSRFSTESGALLMAISHGKAVIASKTLPFKEKEKKGVLITFENVDDLVEKIKFLLNDNVARHKLEEAAMKYAESTSWDKVAKQHIALYEEVLSGKALVDKPVLPA